MSAEVIYWTINIVGAFMIACMGYMVYSFFKMDDFKMTRED